MGTPQNNADGYRSSSVMSHASGIRGHLMLVHGLIDENVHFRHTARLVDALIKRRKPHELLLFPRCSGGEEQEVEGGVGEGGGREGQHFMCAMSRSSIDRSELCVSESLAMP